MNHYANIFIIIGKIGISTLKTKTHAHRMLLLRQKSRVKQATHKKAFYDCEGDETVQDHSWDFSHDFCVWT